jgi:hypothetical protein
MKRMGLRPSKTLQPQLPPLSSHIYRIKNNYIFYSENLSINFRKIRQMEMHSKIAFSYGRSNIPPWLMSFQNGILALPESGELSPKTTTLLTQAGRNFVGFFCK